MKVSSLPFIARTKKCRIKFHFCVKLSLKGVYGQKKNPFLSSLSESDCSWCVLLVLRASRHLQQQRLHYEWKTGAELHEAESLQQLFISIIHPLIPERRIEIMRRKTSGLSILHRWLPSNKGVYHKKIEVKLCILKINCGSLNVLNGCLKWIVHRS